MNYINNTSQGRKQGTSRVRQAPNAQKIADFDACETGIPETEYIRVAKPERR